MTSAPRVTRGRVMNDAAAVAVALGAFPAAAVLPHAYGLPGDPADRLMAAGRRVALRDDGTLCLDGDPVTPDDLAAAAAGLPALPRGRALDQGKMTLRGPCPGCGQDTACGWVERTPQGWRDVRSGPTPCTGCRASAITGAASPDAPCTLAGAAQDAARDLAGTPASPRPAAAVLGAPGLSPASVPVEVRDGALYVNGAAVAEGIDPAAVVVLGRRVCAGGRQVATLTPPSEGDL
jgi:hypothetical protein